MNVELIIVLFVIGHKIRLVYCTVIFCVFLYILLTKHPKPFDCCLIRTVYLLILAVQISYRWPM